MKRLLIIVLIITMHFVPAGCWSSRLLDERAYVYAIGIDPGEKRGEYNFTFQLANPGAFTKESPEKKGFEVIRSSGETMFTAIRGVIPRLGRKLFFPHVQVIIFHKAVAEEGLAPLLDLFSRDPEFSLRPWVMIADNASAADVLALEHPGSKIPALALNHAVKLGQGNHFGASTIKDFLMRLENIGFVPVATLVKICEKGGRKELCLSGTAVFAGDKLAGILTEKETRGMNFITGRARQGILQLEKPRVPENISLEYNQSKARIIPVLEDGEIKFTIEITNVASVGETLGPRPLNDPKYWELIKKAHREEIGEEAKSAIHKARVLKKDILGLGDNLSKKYPRIWQQMAEDWDEIFPGLPIELQVKTRLVNIGDIIEPATKERI